MPERNNRRLESSAEPICHNLFRNTPSQLPEELTEVLAENRHTRIERIVSTGHRSPEGDWYDQKESEWVMVIRGEARLLFEASRSSVLMRPGDHLTIKPHQRHRVEWTTPDEPTIWLAVFFSDVE